MTPDHPIRTADGRWLEAQALYPGTELRSVDGSTGTVDGDALERRSAMRWDLAVAEVHTFGAAGGGTSPSSMSSDR